MHELSMDANNKEFVETMTDTDVLIINYDIVKDQNCETVDIIIELFRKHNKPRPGSLLLPEIWCICNRSGLNSEKSCFSRARTYHKDDDVVYRQIILQDFASKLGIAVAGPQLAMKIVMWWIRRGGTFISVPSPWSALLNYFTFLTVVEIITNNELT